MTRQHTCYVCNKKRGPATPLTEKETKMAKQTLIPFFARLTESTREKLATYAYDNALSQSAVVEHALRAYLSERQPLSKRIGELKVPL